MAAPRVLALETATEACSAALRLGDQTIERFEVAPRGHGRLLLGMMEALMSEAGIVPRDLDAVAFGRGPGAFTGVRIAAGVAQGVAFGADRPVIGVSSLAALARGAARASGHARICAALDARIGQVYWGAYESAAEEPRAVGDEHVSDPEDVPVPPGDGWYGAGPGFASYGRRLIDRLGGRLTAHDGARLPRAADVAALAVPALARREGIKAARALPIYVRDEVARRPGPRAD